MFLDKPHQYFANHLDIFEMYVFGSFKDLIIILDRLQQLLIDRQFTNFQQQIHPSIQIVNTVLDILAKEQMVSIIKYF